MNRLKLVLLSAAVAIAASSCGTTSSLVQRWNEPGYTGKKDAKTVGQYHKGMAVFTVAKGGLMYQAAVGGQKFKYKPGKS